MASAIASVAGVPASAVTITVTSASVQISIAISIAQPAADTTAAGLSSGIFAGPSALEAAFTSAGVVGVSVMAIVDSPTTSTTTTSPPSPSPADSALSSPGGGGGGMIGIAAGGGAVLVSLIVLLYCVRRSSRLKRAGEKKPPTLPSPSISPLSIASDPIDPRRVPKVGDVLEVEVAEPEEKGGAILWKTCRVQRVLAHGRFVAEVNGEDDFIEEYGMEDENKEWRKVPTSQLPRVKRQNDIARAEWARAKWAGALQQVGRLTRVSTRDSRASRLSQGGQEEERDRRTTTRRSSFGDGDADDRRTKHGDPWQRAMALLFAAKESVERATTRKTKADKNGKDHQRPSGRDSASSASGDVFDGPLFDELSRASFADAFGVDAASAPATARPSTFFDPSASSLTERESQRETQQRVTRRRTSHDGALSDRATLDRSTYFDEARRGTLLWSKMRLKGKATRAFTKQEPPPGGGATTMVNPRSLPAPTLAALKAAKAKDRKTSVTVFNKPAAPSRAATNKATAGRRPKHWQEAFEEASVRRQRASPTKHLGGISMRNLFTHHEKPQPPPRRAPPPSSSDSLFVHEAAPPPPLAHGAGAVPYRPHFMGGGGGGGGGGASSAKTTVHSLAAVDEEAPPDAPRGWGALRAAQSSIHAYNEGKRHMSLPPGGMLRAAASPPPHVLRGGGKPERRVTVNLRPRQRGMPLVGGREHATARPALSPPSSRPAGSVGNALVLDERSVGRVRI